MISDLLNILENDTRLKKVASTHGGEFSGPCPFCGGRDRFRVWPEQGRWWCRRCGRKGDSIQYLRDRHGLTFKDACERLQMDPGAPRPAPWLPEPPDDSSPSPAWQRRARQFIDYAREQLWGEAGERALVYLREARLLTDDTIRAWGLGFCPKDMQEHPENLGLTGKLVGLPRGIVIPCEAGGELWYVTVRRPVQGDGLDRYIGGGGAEPKYWKIRGSKRALFGADTLPGKVTVLVCEGEFDCILAHQEAGDLVGVVTIGGAATGLSGRWLWALRDATTILAAFDSDDPGKKAAQKLAGLSERVRPTNLFGSKDISDFAAAGGRIRDWVLSYLPKRASTLPAVPELDLLHCLRCGSPEVVQYSGECGWPLCEAHKVDLEAIERQVAELLGVGAAEGRAA